MASLCARASPTGLSLLPLAFAAELAWILYIVGAVIGGRPTGSTSDESDMYDGVLCSRIFTLVQAAQGQARAHRRPCPHPAAWTRLSPLPSLPSLFSTYLPIIALRSLPPPLPSECCVCIAYERSDAALFASTSSLPPSPFAYWLALPPLHSLPPLHRPLLPPLDFPSFAYTQPEQSEGTQRLHSAILFFLGKFRRVYIGEMSMYACKVYDQLSTVGIHDNTAIMEITVQTVISALRNWSNNNTIISSALNLFSEMAKGFSSGRILFTLPAVGLSAPPSSRLRMLGLLLHLGDCACFVPVCDALPLFVFAYLPPSPSLAFACARAITSKGLKTSRRAGRGVAFPPSLPHLRTPLGVGWACPSPIPLSDR